MRRALKRCVSALMALLLCAGVIQTPVNAALYDLNKTEVARETYEFYADEELYKTVIIKSAEGKTEVLEEPEKPEKEGYYFTGWFTEDGDPYTEFGQEHTLTDGKTIKLHAGFEEAKDVVYIHYHDDEPAEGKTDSILYTAVVKRGDKYSPRPGDTEVSERSEDNISLVVTGWKDAGGTVYSTENPIVTNADTPEEFDLYPVMSKGSWLFFDAAGGVYLDPQFVPYGEPTQEVTTTRDGYTLDGWYDGDTKFEFGNTLDGVKTLTAKWTPTEVNYHVEVWQEAPTYADDSYYLETTLRETATAGTVISAEYLRDIAEDYVNDHWNTPAFSLNEEMTAPYMDIEVKGDGSTVTRIYMKRSRHNLTVLDIDGTEIKRIEGIKYDVDDWTYAGFTFWDNEVWSDPRVKEINEILDENGFSKYYWNPSWWTGFWLDPNTYNMHFRFMRNALGFPEEVSIQATERSNRYPYVINNYFEYLDEETTPEGAERVEHTDFDGVTKTYYFDTSYTVWLNTPSNGNVDIGPDGFHLVRGKGNTVNADGEVLRDTPQEGTNQSKYAIWGMEVGVPTNVFYARNINTVSYIPGKDYADTVYEEALFNDLLSKYPPVGDLKADETIKTVENVTYRFKGWSQTENGDPIPEEELDAMRIFPDKDYTFYGIWEPESYSVEFEPNGGTFTGEKKVTVVSGNSVSQPEDPENGEMKFVGWFTKDNAPYYFGTLLTKEVVEDLGDGETTITLYARYSDFPGTPVEYDLNGGTGETPEEKSLYCTGAAFPAESGEGITPPAGKVFIGWEAADGKLYEPGKTVNVSEDTIKDDVIPLKARYGENPKLTKLQYIYDGREQNTKPALENSTLLEENLTNNSIIELKGFKETTGLDEPENCYFAGWYDNAKCEGEPLTKILVDTENEDEENVVYAKWLPYMVNVIFEEEGGTEVEDQTFEKGGTATDQVTVRDGYSFEGWYTEDGELYDFRAPVMEDITLYAHWKKVEQPKTGVKDSTMLWSFAGLLSFAGIWFFRKKREENA